MKKILFLIPFIALVSLPFTWTYVLGFMTGTHPTCVDDFDSKKIGMTKHSLTIEESKKNGTFIKELKSNKQEILMDSGQVIKIKNIWIETSWKYECLETGLTVISLNIPSILIEANNIDMLLKNDVHVKFGEKFAGFYGGLMTVRIKNHDFDTLKLAFQDSSGHRIDELEIIN